MRIRSIVLVTVAAAGLSLMAAAAGPPPLTTEPLTLAPPASAAPAGHWAFASSYGYLWMPDILEAEWSPFDPWWALPGGRWIFAEGLGWGWCCMPPNPSPLGWGYDGWYGGWYGVRGIGETPCDPRRDTAYAIAWMNRHHSNRTHKAQVVAVVAAAPKALEPMRWRGPRVEASVQPEPVQTGRGWERHRRRGGDRTEPASPSGSGGPRTSPRPAPRQLPPAAPPSGGNLRVPPAGAVRHR
jgi:hypothetical protein